MSIEAVFNTRLPADESTPENKELWRKIEKAAGRSLPVLQTHYGKEVWTNEELDNARRTGCLCLSCNKLATDQSRNCPMAGVLFSMCQTVGMAIAVTRCAAWEPRPLARADG